MKKIMLFSACAAVFAISFACTKNADVIEPVTKGLKACSTASLSPVTKISMNDETLGFSFDAGDQLKIRCAGVTYSGTSYDYLTTEYGGAAASFDGTLSITQKANIYSYYTENGVFESSVYIVHEVPTVQKGSLQDLKDYVLFEKWIKTGDIDDSTPGTLKFSTEMRPVFAVIKFNVPEALNVTSVKISAQSEIAGKIKVVPNKLTSGVSYPGTAIGSGNAQYYNRVGETLSKEITISNGGIVKGDIYAVVIPDKIDTEKKELYCSTPSLTFTLTDGNAQTKSFTANLNQKIYNRSMKDLGSIPENFFTRVDPTGSLCLIDAVKPTISVKDTLAGCKFYLETGSSEAGCKDPTIESKNFDAKHGIALASADYKKTFVKVLMVSDTGGKKMLKGYLRIWNFNNTSNVYKTLASAVAEEPILPKLNDNVTVDDMYIYRRAEAAFSFNSNYEDHIVVNNPIIFGPIVSQDCAAYIWVKAMNNNTTVGSNRGFNLAVNKATGRVNTYNGNATSTTLKRENPSKMVGFVWNLGSVKKDNIFAPCPDGETSIYAFGILEVL